MSDEKGTITKQQQQSPPPSPPILERMDITDMPTNITEKETFVCNAEPQHPILVGAAAGESCEVIPPDLTKQDEDSENTCIDSTDNEQNDESVLEEAVMSDVGPPSDLLEEPSSLSSLMDKGDQSEEVMIETKTDTERYTEQTISEDENSSRPSGLQDLSCVEKLQEADNESNGGDNEMHDNTAQVAADVNPTLEMCDDTTAMPGVEITKAEDLDTVNKPYQTYQSAFEEHIKQHPPDEFPKISGESVQHGLISNDTTNVDTTEDESQSSMRAMSENSSNEESEEDDTNTNPFGDMTLTTTETTVDRNNPSAVNLVSVFNTASVTSTPPVNIVNPVNSKLMSSSPLQKLKQQTLMMHSLSGTTNSATQQLQNLALQQMQHQGTMVSQSKPVALPFLQSLQMQPLQEFSKLSNVAPVAIVSAQSCVPTMVTGIVHPLGPNNKQNTCMTPTNIVANILPKPMNVPSGSSVQFVASNNQTLQPGMVTSSQVLGQLQALTVQQNMSSGTIIGGPSQLGCPTTVQSILVKTTPPCATNTSSEIISSNFNNAQINEAIVMTKDGIPIEAMASQTLPRTIATILSPGMHTSSMMIADGQRSMIAVNSQGVGVAINPIMIRRPTRGRPRKFPRPNMGNRMPARIKPKTDSMKAGELRGGVRGRGCRRVGRPRGSSSSRKLAQMIKEINSQTMSPLTDVDISVVPPLNMVTSKASAPVMPVQAMVVDNIGQAVIAAAAATDFTPRHKVSPIPYSSSFVLPRTELRREVSSPGPRPPPLRQKAIVKPHIMNHVIEGFTIQEWAEPFAVQKSSLLTVPELNPLMRNKLDRQDMTAKRPKPKLVLPNQPQTYLKCEFCGKIDREGRFRRSKRFCSLACSKRYNVGCSKRLGLFRPPNRPAGTSMPDRPTCKHKKGFLVKKEWRRGHLPFSATGPTVNESIVDPPTQDDIKHMQQRIQEAENQTELNEDQTGSSDEMSSGSTSSSQDAATTATTPPSTPSNHREEPVINVVGRQEPVIDVVGLDPEEMGESESNAFNIETNSNQESEYIPHGHPATWAVMDVYDFLKSLSGCESYAEEFRSQEIDGQALLLLKEDHLISTMNMKLGPALKVCAKINSLKGGE